MNLVIPSKEYYALDIPASVQNDDKLIHMLGGSEEILHVFRSEKRRLRLNFRPHMVYAKPACGDAIKSAGLLLSVKQYRNRNTGELLLVPTILGSVTRTYKFDGMIDFQFGPFDRITSTNPQQQHPSSTLNSTTTDKYRLFYKDLLIREPSTSLDPHLMRDAPLYLPPVLFSRHDHPNAYTFNSRYRSSEYIDLEEQIQRQTIARKARHNYSCIISMDDPTPLAPHPMNAERLKSNQAESLQMKEMFNKQPVWARNALVYRMKIRRTVFQLAIFDAAYYMVGGPWGRSWIRFGYDPRTDPESRYYQVIDFRIKSHVWIDKISQKQQPRSGILLSTQRKRNSQRTNQQCLWIGSSFISDNVLNSPGPSSCKPEADEDGDQEDVDLMGEDEEMDVETQDTQQQQCDFRFSPDHIPRSQQMLLCLKDIEIPEVQQFLAKKPTRTCCDPVDGWLDPGVLGKIRELMTKHLKLWLGDQPDGD